MCHLINSGKPDKHPAPTSTHLINYFILLSDSNPIIRYFRHAVNVAQVLGWTGNDGEAQRVSSSAAPGEKNGKEEWDCMCRRGNA